MYGDDLTISGLGRVMKGWLEPEESGLLVKPGGLQGWESLPASRRDALERALAHGEHDVPVWLPARVITVDALAIARSIAELRTLGHRVRGWGATGDRFRLTVDHQGESLYANVRSMLRDASDQGLRDGDLYLAEVQVQFLAADPRKYGPLAKFPAGGTATSIPVFHRGNFPANPVVEIPSAPAAYTVSSPGGVFTVAGATPGGTHRVDLRTGRVFRDGEWMSDIGTGQTWAVPEGATWVHTLSVPGRVLVADTFV